MKSRVKSQSGITLLEIMVTVVIIGLVSAMAVPRMNAAIDRLNFTTAMRSLRSSIKVARSMSVSDKTSYGVYFNPSKKTYTVFKEIANIGAFSFDTGDSVITVDTLPRQFNSLSTTLTNNVILFRPNGSASFGGVASITATGATDVMTASANLTVLASTGRIDDNIAYSN